MKRLLCLLLAASLCLCACAAAPAETTAPPETTVPEITVPETTVPAVFEPYTITRDGEMEWLYAGPGFVWGIKASVIDQKVFWINEEATDPDGNLWGKVLADCWLCLTEPAIVPLRAEYAPEGIQPDESWSSGETEYVTDMLLTAEQDLTDVKLWSMAFEEADFVRDSVLHTVERMNSGATLLASVVFYGDMTCYGLTFTDEAGQERCYILSISGMDGALLCTECAP